MEKITSNVFYNVIRYRLCSHIFKGERRVKYRNKYIELKNYLKSFKIEKVYFCGIRIITIKSNEIYKCHYILNIPFVVQIFKQKSYTLQMLSVNIIKTKRNFGIECYCEDEVTEKKLASLSQTEKGIYHLIQSMKLLGSK